jgi:recombination protein RecA
MPTASTERPSIAELKLAIAARAPSPQTELPFATLASGWAEVDAVLGGGLPRGRLSEIAGARSSGKASLALATAARASAAKQLVAWIDGPGELYPPVAAAQGVDLERLLIVRTGSDGLAAARAGEIVARSRAFGLVVMDVGERGSFPERAAARLRAAAFESGVTVVALVTRRGALPHAHCQLEVAGLSGDPAALRRFQVTVVRGGVQPGARVVVGQGSPSLASFREAPVEAELEAAAEAIRPLRWRSK